MMSPKFLLLRFWTVRISSNLFLWVAKSEGGMNVDTVIMSVTAIAWEWNLSCEMVHVEDERLMAILLSELVVACDEQMNSLSVHIQVGQVVATHNVVRLGVHLADPRCSALEREGTIFELLVKLVALIVYAMIDDNRRDETEASIGRINAHDVEPIEEKLELLAQSARLLFVPLDFDCLEPEALGPGPGASHLDLVYL